MAADILGTLITELRAHPTRTYPNSTRLMAAFAAVMQGGFMTSVPMPGGGATALDVPTNGDPKFAIVVNDNTYVTGIKLYGMTGAYAIKIHTTGPVISKANNMITLDTGKLTIGIDTDLNTAHTAHVMYALNSVAV